MQEQVQHVPLYNDIAHFITYLECHFRVLRVSLVNMHKMEELGTCSLELVLVRSVDQFLQNTL